MTGIASVVQAQNEQPVVSPASSWGIRHTREAETALAMRRRGPHVWCALILYQPALTVFSSLCNEFLQEWCFQDLMTLLLAPYLEYSTTSASQNRNPGGHMSSQTSVCPLNS